ncbi:MAG: hypothetical protein HC838_15030 [Spirulinaceae cyanobacterium RM2_2_10]|nr:hypothetical protein [Spirulinaceae cyanobacterium RM2_2_10]
MGFWDDLMPDAQARLQSDQTFFNAVKAFVAGGQTEIAPQGRDRNV